MKIITRKYLLIFCLNYIKNKRKGLPDNGNRRGAAPLEDNEKEPCFLRHGSVCRKSSPTAIFSDRLAPSAYSLANIGVLCAAAHSPCICSFANIGVLRADRAQPLYLLVRKYRRSVRYRAQPLYLLTPAGHFALRATAHWADASLRRTFGSLWAFGPSVPVAQSFALP